MKKIEFDEERRGYDKEQVDRYVFLLQKAVGEMEGQLKVSEKELEGKGEELKLLSEKCENLEKELEGKNKETVSTRILQQKLENVQKLYSDSEKAKRELENSYKKQQQKMTAEIDRLIEENKNSASSEIDMNELNRKLEEALSENQKLKEELQKMSEQSAESTRTTADVQGIETIFQQAKESADAYVKDVQRQVREERIEIESENKRLIAEAKEEAERIVNEAKAQKQEALDEKMRSVAELEREKKIEYAELLQNAQDEVDSAKVEAEGIRNQAKLIVAQAEQRRDRILQRANEKAEIIAGPVKEEYVKICEDMGNAMERFAKYYRDLIKDEEAAEQETM